MSQGTAVLEHGLKWQPMSVKNNEGQFLESRAFQLLEVARLFRLPPHKLMDVSKGTMNNMETQNGEYVQDCLMSWIVQLEEEFKAKLVHPNEVMIFPKFLVRSFFRGDMAARTEYIAMLVQWGVINRNEAREMEDFNPVDGLDTYLVPQNFSAASALENMTRSQLSMLMLQAKNAGAPQVDAEGNIIPGQALPMLPVPTATTDNPDVDEQEDPAEQVAPIPNVPPPPGIVLPGTQPIDDSFFGRSRKVAQAQAPVLAGIFRSLLHTESDKVCRAAKKEGFTAWADDFYSKHQEHVRSTIKPVVVAIASSVWAMGDDPTPEVRAKVDQFINDLATRHVAASKADLADSEGLEQRVKGWDARIDQVVKEEMEQLATIIIPSKG